MDRTEARSRLGVQGGASSAAIDAAFRRRAMTVHPDRGGDPDEFRLLVESRRVLLTRLPRPVIPPDDRSLLVKLVDRARGRRRPTGRVV